MGVLVNMLLVLTWCMCAVNPVGSQVNLVIALLDASR